MLFFYFIEVNLIISVSNVIISPNLLVSENFNGQLLSLTGNFLTFFSSSPYEHFCVLFTDGEKDWEKMSERKEGGEGTEGGEGRERFQSESPRNSPIFALVVKKKVTEYE